MGARRSLTTGAAYIDASAAVKLLVHEPESSPLRSTLEEVGRLASTEILRIELTCVARRRREQPLLDEVRRVLASIDLLPLTDEVRARALEAFEPPQRTLDAIHLATAQALDVGGLAFVSYDRDQAEAARAAGLTVLSPA